MRMGIRMIYSRVNPGVPKRNSHSEKQRFQRHRHVIRFLNVLVQTPTRGEPIYGYSEKPPHFSRLLRCAWGYGGPILVLNPVVPTRNSHSKKQRKRSSPDPWQHAANKRNTQKKAKRQHKNTTKMYVYTTVADRLRKVSWSNCSHPTSVVNWFTGPTFTLPTTAVHAIERTNANTCYQPYHFV